MRGNLVINLCATEASLQKEKCLGRGFPAGLLSFSAGVQPPTRDTPKLLLGKETAASLGIGNTQDLQLGKGHTVQNPC